MALQIPNPKRAWSLTLQRLFLIMHRHSEKTGHPKARQIWKWLQTLNHHILQYTSFVYV